MRQPSTDRRQIASSTTNALASDVGTSAKKAEEGAYRATDLLHLVPGGAKLCGQGCVLGLMLGNVSLTRHVLGVAHGEEPSAERAADGEYHADVCEGK
jgi:hypothetical protein